MLSDTHVYVIESRYPRRNSEWRTTGFQGEDGCYRVPVFLNRKDAATALTGVQSEHKDMEHRIVPGTLSTPSN